MMSRLTWIAAALLTAGCSKSPHGDAYFPLDVGARWEYDVASDIDSTLTHKTLVASVDRVVENEAGDQIVVRRVESPSEVGIEFWLRQDKNGIVRIAKRVDVEAQAKLDRDPRMVLKMPLVQGATWMVPSEPFIIGPKTDLGQREVKMPKVLMNYTVEAVDDTVTVPAGTFKNCARAVGVGMMPLFVDAVQGFVNLTLTNREWYCKGVGLVKVERDEPLNSMLWSGGKITMVLTEYKLH
jgi:hypothetical protein